MAVSGRDVVVGSFTTEVVGDWIVKAAAHINEVTIYLEKDMHLTQCQIDALWSYI